MSRIYMGETQIYYLLHPELVIVRRTEPTRIAIYVPLSPAGFMHSRDSQHT